MSLAALVAAIRAVSLLAVAGPMLIGRRDRARATTHAGRQGPVVANLAAFGAFFVSLFWFAGPADGIGALVSAAVGALLATLGVGLVMRSRAELGSAWSLVPKAGRETGLITTGPYRMVRHPIYLGFGVLALGQAVAFRSWPAVAIVVLAVVPTFAWRARAEEAVLVEAFGEPYARYRSRTGAIIPRPS